MPITTFYAIDNGASGAVNPVGGPALQRAAFLAVLAGSVTSFGFESGAILGGDTAPLTAAFVGSGATTINAVIHGTGQVRDSPTQGRFNTTPSGSKYWEVLSGASTQFNITFNAAISAFGFYASDIGDFGGSLDLVFTRQAGGTDTVNVPVVSGQDANLIFMGAVDSTARWTAVSFVTTGGTQADLFGFDDFIIADSGQVITASPPPSASTHAILFAPPYGVTDTGELVVQISSGVALRQDGSLVHLI